MRHVVTAPKYYIDFSTLRTAYNEVKTFIEKETFDTVTSLNTKIEKDLGYSGDDNWELLQKFVTTYQLDATEFDYSTHFESESELFDSSAAGLMLLGLPVVIFVRAIRIISFGKVDWTNKQLFPDWHRETLDLTFGDMLTWYLTGKYNLRKDINFRLKGAFPADIFKHHP